MNNELVYKEYFCKYVSNTLLSTMNQFYFKSDNELRKGRLYVKLHDNIPSYYSFLFDNEVDSTIRIPNNFGEVNKKCDEYEIKSFKFGFSNNLPENESEEIIFNNILFSGKENRKVLSGETLYSDEVYIDIKDYIYLVLEIEYSGTLMPCFPEIMAPIYSYSNGEFVRDTNVVIPQVIGKRKNDKKTLSFIGDSITEGIGPELDSYDFYVSVASKKLTNKFNFYNIGIGFATSSDFSTLGCWYKKAIYSSDIVTVCFGVNDLFHFNDNEIIKANLLKTVLSLKNKNITVILLTIPPFDYNEIIRKRWIDLNDYIMNELNKYADYIFDVRKYLEKEINKGVAIYGGHPNSEGSFILGSALKEFIELKISV